MIGSLFDDMGKKSEGEASYEIEKYYYITIDYR
jgi:hypothetical protein